MDGQRRQFRFSLATLFLVTTLVFAAFYWMRLPSVLGTLLARFVGPRNEPKLNFLMPEEEIAWVPIDQPRDGSVPHSLKIRVQGRERQR